MRALTALSLAAALTIASPAPAQEEEPGGRGVIGGALIGAELTLVGEALAGVEPAWAYFLGGALGAGAGAFGGSVVEDRAHPDASNVLLAVGVALVIPTAILVGNLVDDRPPPPSHVRLLAPSVRIESGRHPGATLELLRGQF